MLLTVKESLITKEFADKLAMARNDSQLDKLVEEIIEKQFQSPIKKGWNIPTLDQMEVEVAHLASYWNDKRVSAEIPFRKYKKELLVKLTLVRISCSVNFDTLQLCCYRKR